MRHEWRHKVYKISAELQIISIINRELKCADTNWHIAGSLGWQFPKLKYKYIFQIKCTEANVPNSTRKLLWLEITEMLIAV